jgi:hypothetical protein
MAVGMGKLDWLEVRASLFRPAAGACTARQQAGQGPVFPAKLSFTWSCDPQ